MYAFLPIRKMQNRNQMCDRIVVNFLFPPKKKSYIEIGYLRGWIEVTLNNVWNKKTGHAPGVPGTLYKS